MSKKQEDRRKSKVTPVFPLINSEGKLVSNDVRSGKDRRKNRRGDNIANNIMGIVN